MDRPLSLAALTVIELTPPEVVKCAALAGYSHVGLRLLPVTPRGPSFDILGDTPMRRSGHAARARRRSNCSRNLDPQIAPAKNPTRQLRK